MYTLYMPYISYISCTHHSSLSLVFSYRLHWIPLNFTFEVLPRTRIPCNPSSGKPAGGNVLRSVSHHDMLMSWYISLYIIIWHRSEVRLGLGGLRGPVAAAHWCLDVWRSPVSCGTCERCNEINEIKDSTFKKLRPHLDWFIPHPDLIMKHEATCILIRVCPLFFFIFLPLLFCGSFFFVSPYITFAVSVFVLGYEKKSDGFHCAAGYVGVVEVSWTKCPGVKLR